MAQDDTNSDASDPSTSGTTSPTVPSESAKRVAKDETASGTKNESSKTEEKKSSGGGGEEDPETGIRIAVVSGAGRASITLRDSIPDFVGRPDDPCPVCRTPITERVVAAPCFHAFCSSCLKTWVTGGRNIQYSECPVCRTSISSVYTNIQSGVNYTTTSFNDFRGILPSDRRTGSGLMGPELFGMMTGNFHVAQIKFIPVEDNNNPPAAIGPQLPPNTQQNQNATTGTLTMEQIHPEPTEKWHPPMIGPQLPPNPPPPPFLMMGMNTPRFFSEKRRDATRGELFPPIRSPLPNPRGGLSPLNITRFQESEERQHNTSPTRADNNSRTPSSPSAPEKRQNHPPPSPFPPSESTEESDGE